MNKYKSYTPEQLENLFSNYLIDSWSYSMVSCFSRNEKAFEKNYIYREPDKRSISSVAGNAYHEALKAFFQAYNEKGAGTALVDLTAVAYEYLDELPANDFKLTDKFPTMEQAKTEATRIVNALIENFCSEMSVYTDSIKRVIDVETKYSSWVTVNGVDIPLPLHFVVDLAVETNDGEYVIIDHKSKSAYTSEAEAALTHGQQAITYVIGWETENNARISEVWFIENKISKNKDKSPQLRKHILNMDADSRVFYEYNLYKPLKRMIEAAGDPDYVFTCNNYDNLCDLAALYEFDARTMMAEVEDFENVQESKREMIAKRLCKIKDSSRGMISPKVITQFRNTAASFISFDYSHSNMTPSEKIEHAFRTFGKQVQVAHEIQGFSCDTYLCDVAAGVQMNQLNYYAKDIAYALDVPSVRIASNLVMHEGKSYLSIEVNKKRTETLLWDKSYMDGLRLPLGLDNFRQPVVWDLDNHSTPHALVCGCTGSGKSVMIRSTIRYAQEAGVKNIVILDPKWEFTDLEGAGVKVFNEIADIEVALEGMVTRMNEMVKSRQKEITLVLFDEFADAQDQSKEMHRRDKENPTIPLEVSFKMLLQKGRSCGFRFLAATQRADTKTISGSTKVNFPVLVCFRVPKAIDSKVVLDEEGANTLAGGGDGLVKSPEYLDRLIRFQGFYCR